MGAVLFFMWFVFVTVQSLIIMFTDSFFGGLFSWFVLVYIVPAIFGAFDNV